jgi:hypothetical protein
MSVIYPKALEQMLQGGIDLSGTVKAALIDIDVYTYASGDQYYSAISSAVIGTPQALIGKTYSLGIFSSANPVFSGLTGAVVEAVVIYIDTGTESTSPLVAYIDQATGLPFTPSGGSASLVWNASGIFQL